MNGCTDAIIYLRLSDGRVEEAFDGRETKLRAEAARIGWNVVRVVIENDTTEDGRVKPSSAFKRKKIVTPKGEVELRTVRPRFREIVLPEILAGRSLLAEDLDRVCRDPRDLEDVLDAVEISGASARSLSGSLTLTDGGTGPERSLARSMINFKNMESEDKQRRVTEGRERHAGKSYGGGRRPYGYRADPDAEKYHKNLLVVPGEADLLRQAAADLLNGSSLGSIARDWRERGIPTVTGKPWTTQALKDALIKPSIAGLAVKWEGKEPNRVRTLVPAPWQPILDRDVWEKLVDKLKDPARKTTTGNQPRWLVSKFATCGKCGSVTYVVGGPREKKYQCSHARHLTRSAHAVDEFISALVIARLSQPDIREYLKPPPRPGIAAGKLRTERRKLRDRRVKLTAMFADGRIEESDYAAGIKRVRDKLTRVEALLAESDAPDPLAEFRDKPAEVVWKTLPVGRRRAVVQTLFESIVFLPVGTRNGPRFDPESVEIAWKS